MKLDFIELKNFRQFYGDDNRIECSMDPQKNVTLIHAENGVGKTTLLNSILWAFYGETTDRFEQRDKIVNFEAAREGRHGAAVTVGFEANNDWYSIQRHFVANGAKGEHRPKAFKVVDGVHKDIPATETFINAVLPREMARYFFFDGEHAEAFAAENNQKAVGAAIRSMLGCEIAETAINDLKHIAGELGREMGSSPGDLRMNEIELEIERLEANEAKYDERIKQLEENVSAAEQQIAAITAKLRETAVAREIQLDRDAKEAEKKRLALELKSIEDDIVRWVGTKSILVVSKKLATQTLEFVDEASLRGKIPSPYNEDFVKGLLHAEQCVCDRPLKSGTAEYGAVMSLLKTATNVETLRRVVAARSRVQQVKENTPEAIRTLEKLQARAADVSQRHMVLEQQVEELSKKLRELPLTEIAEREQARRTLQRRLADDNQAIGAAKLERSNAQRSLDELSRERDRLAGKHARTRRIMVRRDFAKQASEFLKALLGAYEVDARNLIQGEINRILAKTTRREYRFRFNDDFSMDLLFENGQPVPRSGGENQLMSLAFTSALIYFAQLRVNAKDEILTPGTVAPLVLDSPFGQLDKKYREATALFVPQMASQVVLLVSSSQGDDTVLKALEPYVGAEYVLISENRGNRGDKTEDIAHIRNKEYRLSLYNQPRTLTRIERVL